MIKKCIYRFTSKITKTVVGSKAEIGCFVRMHKCVIDNYSYVSKNSSIFYTKIGKFTSIGSGCNIGGGEHPLEWVSTSPVFHKDTSIGMNLGSKEYSAYKTTIIGNDVWIAANVIIKSGVAIGDGAVIGAGTVVVKDVGPYEVVVGNPGRCIKKRFNEDIVDELIQLQWWDFPIGLIKKNSDFIDDPELFINKMKGEIGEK